MNRKAFYGVVLLVVIFIGWALVNGNRLPAEMRAQIQSEQKQLADARKQIGADRATVTREAAADPELFRVRAFDAEWPRLFTEAGVSLTEAEQDGSSLTRLLARNNRSDKNEAQVLLDRERRRRSAAVREAESTLAEAQKRVDLKQHFPQTLSKIDGETKTLASADYAAITAKVQKAESDWPSKKDDLQGRLNALLAPKTESAQWTEQLKSLEAKPVTALTAADYTTGLELEESVDHAPGAKQAQDLESASQQLYTSWDNVLDDLDKEHDGCREKVKHVVTTVPAPTEKGITTSTETWVDVTPDQWRGLENNIGMTIAHKPLGKYDSEADRTPQPAGFAYMASPSEGRNQYGYWDNRGGSSVWTWLPEYLILRNLLSPRYYQPIPSYDWDRYRQAQRYGQTYYGRDESGAPKFGSHGTFTQRSYANSRYVQSGGFSGSKYASGPGGFSGSKYGSGGPGSTSSSSGQRFGSSASGSAPHKYGGSSGHSFGSSRSAGRSFGGRRH